MHILRRFGWIRFLVVGVLYLHQVFGNSSYYLVEENGVFHVRHNFSDAFNDAVSLPEHIRIFSETLLVDRPVLQGFNDEIATAGGYVNHRRGYLRIPRSGWYFVYNPPYTALHVNSVKRDSLLSYHRVIWLCAGDDIDVDVRLMRTTSNHWGAIMLDGPKTPLVQLVRCFRRTLTTPDNDVFRVLKHCNFRYKLEASSDDFWIRSGYPVDISSTSYVYLLAWFILPSTFKLAPFAEIVHRGMRRVDFPLKNLSAYYECGQNDDPIRRVIASLTKDHTVDFLRQFIEFRDEQIIWHPSTTKYLTDILNQKIIVQNRPSAQRELLAWAVHFQLRMASAFKSNFNLEN